MTTISLLGNDLAITRDNHCFQRRQILTGAQAFEQIAQALLFRKGGQRHGDDDNEGGEKSLHARKVVPSRRQITGSTPPFTRS